MADAPTTLEILIDIRAKLDALGKTQSGLKTLGKEAGGLGELFKTGLGIGTGMEVARRAIELFTETLGEAIHRSSELADEIDKAHNRVGIQGDTYQAIAAEARAAGTDVGEMVQSMAQFRARLGESLLDPLRGNVFTQLSLDAQKLARLPIEAQLERVATALANVGDANVRARLAQDLFGRGAAALQPILEKLRAEGVDKLTSSARAAGQVLDDSLVEKLNAAKRAGEETMTKMAVDMAPVNMLLLEMKNNALGMVAALARPIGNLFGGDDIRRAAAREAALKEAADFRGRATGVASQQEAVDVNNAIVRRGIELQQEREKLTYMPFAGDDEKARLKDIEDELQTLHQVYELLHRDVDKFIEKNSAGVNLVKEQADAHARLAAAQSQARVWQIGDDTWAASDAQTRRHAITAIDDQISALKRLIAVEQKLPLNTDRTAEKRDAEIAKIQAAINELEAKKTGLIAPTTDYAKIEKAYGDYLNSDTSLPVYKRRPTTRLQGPDGVMRENPGGTELTSFRAGAMQWVTSLGSAGQQVAKAVESTLGTAVQGISQGIYGWVTGAETFGQALRNIGGSILQTMLRTIIQMGVQWVIVTALAKLGLTSTFLLGSSFRKAETADVIANETAKAPAIMANAAGASVSSFGIAAALGLAALLAVIAAFGGFRESGGDVQAGRAYVVGEKRPEVFVPDQNGTIIPSLDSLPVPAAARARSVASAPSLSASSALANANGSGSRASDQNHYWFFDRAAMARALASDMRGIAHNVFDERTRKS